MDENPLNFDELVDAWNTLCEQPWVGNAEDFQFVDIESAAISALSDEPTAIRTGTIGDEISRKLSNFDYPTFLVTKKGQVAAINMAASTELELNIGDKIDQLPYALESAQKISEIVRTSLQSTQAESDDACLVRAYGKDNERVATIAVTASFGAVPTALVFIITTRWQSTSLQLLKNQHGLTDAESDLLTCFIDGYSTQAIARIRSRSHATVRTQLQSVLTKTGACNQTELLRIALSLSDFSRQFGVIADAVKHPHRRRAEILREGGRLVEVTLMGDYKGLPILMIANCSNYRFSARIEQQLYDAGLCLISVCGPGYGGTDHAPEGKPRLGCLAEDVDAIFKQLAIQQCPMMAYATNSPLCYAVANSIPRRISHIVHIGALAPYRFITSFDTHSSWVNGIMKAGLKHPSLKKILYRGAFKAFATIGTRQFMRLQLKAHAVEAKFIFLEENMVELEYALKISTKGGFANAAEDIQLCFEDWSQEVEAFPANITILHGKQDALFTIESVRQFAAEYPDKTTMTELDNAGLCLLMSHPDEVIRLLRSIAEQHSRSAAMRVGKHKNTEHPQND